MKLSQSFFLTQRDNPRDAEIVSHQLMARSTLIRKHAAGLYSYLPFLTRSFHKLSQIVREELDGIGWQEIIMPFVIPAELWKETGRWDLFEGLMLQFKDRKQNDFCLGPTHEEVVTDIVRAQVNSYKQLPLTLYQITPKFRDETRPRFGLMRAREFVMMDGYSFHPDKADLDKHYEVVAGAYERIFDRSGLRYARVEADTGAIGGTGSHEYQVLAGSGEDAILICPSCKYAANVEKAEAPKPEQTLPESQKNVSSAAKLELVSTPTQKTISEVSAFLKIPESLNLKTLVYRYTTTQAPKEAKTVAVFILGHRQLNEVKLKATLSKMGISVFELGALSEESVAKVFGSPVGFLGPVNAPANILCLFDREIIGRRDLVCGANKEGHHFKHLDPARDIAGFKNESCVDLVNAVAGDPCPRCAQGKYEAHRGIEVGHIFKLGDKYSKAMNVSFQSADKQSKIMEMGTYGIGVTRILAACVEQNHDADGMIWPESLAPYKLIILGLGNAQDEKVAKLCEEIYAEAKKQGIDVLYDDRDLSPGVKFKDADLMGIPRRLIVGKKGIEAGQLEFSLRKNPKEKIAFALGTPAKILELVLKS